MPYLLENRFAIVHIGYKSTVRTQAANAWLTHQAYQRQHEKDQHTVHPPLYIGNPFTKYHCIMSISFQ